jgi:hypothetical protein
MAQPLLSPPRRVLQERLGRDLGPSAQRWGPRPIDLDIVFYEGGAVAEGDTLVVPHPRWQERDFVKAPLADLWDGDATPSGSGGGGDGPGAGAAAAPFAASSGLAAQLRLAAGLWQGAGGERQLGGPGLECVLPMGRLGLWPWQRRTQVCVWGGGG